MHDILDIIKNIQTLYETNSGLAALKDFERVLDEMDIYVYDNWIDGELAYGPQIDRHWITAGFMWPRDKMPDPTAAKRLTDLGCKIKYQKTNLIQPRKIKTASDYRPGTKKGKLDKLPIWIVEIQMPKKVAFDVYRGYMDRLKNETKEEAPKQQVPQMQSPQGQMVQPGQGMAAPTAQGAAPMGQQPMQPTQGMQGGQL